MKMGYLIWNMVLLSADLIWNNSKLFNLEIQIRFTPFKYQIHCSLLLYHIYILFNNNNNNYNNN